jgi:hypothetical protein
MFQPARFAAELQSKFLWTAIPMQNRRQRELIDWTFVLVAASVLIAVSLAISTIVVP